MVDDQVRNYISGGSFNNVIQVGRVEHLHLHGSESTALGESTTPPVYRMVPTNKSELDFVMGHRPKAWEYLLYAGALQIEIDSLKASAGSRNVPSLDIRDQHTALTHITKLMGELPVITREFMPAFDPEFMSRALGEPGRPGEFRLIFALSKKLTAIYEKLLDWSLKVQRAEIPRQLRQVFEILGHMADRPMLDIESYTARLVGEIDSAIEQAIQGSTEPAVLHLVCTLTADEELSANLMTAMEQTYRRR